MVNNPIFRVKLGFERGIADKLYLYPLEIECRRSAGEGKRREEKAKEGRRRFYESFVAIDY